MPSTSLNIKNTIGAKFKYFDLSDLNKIVTTARKGIKPQVFYDFAKTINMPEKKLAAMINLSSRTISNYKNERKPFGSDFKGPHYFYRLFKNGFLVISSEKNENNLRG